jgi:hypothetical protein
MYVLSIVVCPFVLFLLAIVLSVLLRYTVSDYLPLVSSNSSVTVKISTFIATIYLKGLLIRKGLVVNLE